MNDCFARRRREFLEKMGKGIAILASAPERTRSRDIDYPYRQDSDFYYLTGVSEPKAWAVLDSTMDQNQFVLFVQPSDQERETWEGKRMGVNGAMKLFGVDYAYENSSMEEKL